MFTVDIHPFADRMPNKLVKITSYKFKTREEAIDFVNHYNAHSVVKVALFVEEQESEFA